MARYFMGVDNGGTMTKAAVFDVNGQLLGMAGCACTLETPKPGFTERDMERLWQDTAGVINQALKRAGIASREIAAVACTGHGKGLYLWGRDNRPARAGIVSTDTRAESYVSRWNKDGTLERVYPHILQKLLVSQPCALLAWIKEHEPCVYENTQWIFEAKDYIRFRLTGEARAEKTDYSGTGLMNLNTMCFDRELLESYGIAEMERCLPPLAEATEVCGMITAEAAKLTGLTEGTPVAGGMFDIDACAIASGVVDEDSLCVIAGTWSINEFVSRSPVKNKKISMNSAFCLPGYYLAEESSPTSAGNLEWFVRSILSCDKANAEKEGKRVYALLDEMVEKTSLQEDAPLFFPYLFGAPDMPLAKAVFWGLTACHEKADVVRAIFEGIVFGHREHIDKLLLCRTRPACIRLSGGAANSHVWTQMFADILRIPVEPVAVKEPGALGCAMAAAVAAGDYSDLMAAVSNMAPKGMRIKPNAKTELVYERKYRQYQKVKTIMEPLWKVTW